jgi:threonine dehydrogenase-like Zn-dependent dehydrogenase
VDTSHVISLPDSIPLDIGGKLKLRPFLVVLRLSVLTKESTALVEPLAVAWHAVSRSPLQANDTALVVGGGPIGLAIIQVLKAKGITSIITVEPAAMRRQRALALGATEILDPSEVNAVTQVRALTGGIGAAVAFECSGVQAGLDTAVAGLQVGGTVVIVSLWEHAPRIDAFSVVFQEKHIMGAALYDDGDFEAVIDAIASGRFGCCLVPCWYFLVADLLPIWCRNYSASPDDYW